MNDILILVVKFMLLLIYHISSINNFYIKHLNVFILFRYFLAHVFQFQIFDVLCEEAGYQGPLHLCDLHGSIAAGEKLKYIFIYLILLINK